MHNDITYYNRVSFTLVSIKQRDHPDSKTTFISQTYSLIPAGTSDILSDSDNVYSTTNWGLSPSSGPVSWGLDHLSHKVGDRYKEQMRVTILSQESGCS